MPLDADVKKKIRSSETLGEMFRHLQTHYDLDQVKMGFVYKNVLLSKIDTIVDLLNPPKKNGSIRSH